MRKAQKKMALEFVQTLYQAHEQIRSMIDRKEMDHAMDLLEQCQEGAIQLGGLIEQEEGEGFVTVGLLEDYCEIIYQFHENIGVNGTDSNAKMYKVLHKQLIQVENSIKNDIRQKIEAVFLPYNASMWDSLESVWKAADEDENCDAYVIPIPYYDKNADGSFKEEHWEGDQYPDYVPITKYNAYDFEKRHPDIIFIHNPYDDCNYVTSVHPFFYSRNLKQFTDNLVYIPYFILDEISPDNQKSIERMQHFCTVPGVINADTVIVQSENMRQIYINVITKIAGEDTRGYWENKILGIGSPKIDKVLNTGKEALEIPEEWMRVILKSDGSRKKIIFYNTGLAGLLEYNEHMLRKIKYVFSVFQENKEEVALLWRPHPLIESTLMSMRPQLLEEYKIIKDKYIREGWGIFDNTTDMDRAVMLSDAYYGDRSSIVHLYMLTGKKIMLQNVNSMPDSRDSFAMDNIVEHDGDWYFISLKDNGIYKFNEEKKTAELIVRIPWNLYDEMPEYGKIHIYNNKIFVIPWYASNIVVFDMLSNELRYISLSDNSMRNGQKFLQGIERGNRLYLIPCVYDKIFCINMEEELITETYTLPDPVKDNIQEDVIWAIGSVYTFEDKIAFTSMVDNRIFTFSTSSGELTYEQFAAVSDKNAGICGDKNTIWIVPKKAEYVLCFDKESKTMNKFTNFPPNYKSGTNSFNKLFLDEEVLYLLPREANMILAINKEGDMQEVFVQKEKGVDVRNLFDRYIRYSCMWKNNGHLFLVASKEGELFEVVKKNAIRISKPVFKDEKVTWELTLVNERGNRFENLENFINIICDSDEAEFINKSSHYGISIWDGVIN